MLIEYGDWEAWMVGICWDLGNNPINPNEASNFRLGRIALKNLQNSHTLYPRIYTLGLGNTCPNFEKMHWQKSNFALNMTSLDEEEASKKREERQKTDWFSHNSISQTDVLLFLFGKSNLL